MSADKNFVSVNGHRLHVHVTGNGTKTIVFLAGAMITAPVLEYKPLYTRLTDSFRIAVVEKAGYGFSEGNTGASRDVRTMVEESRAALQQSGVQPPYLLAAHSYSGMEAVYWAAAFPRLS